MFRMDSFLSTSRTIGRYYNLLSRYFLGERLDTHGKGASRGRGLLVSMGHLEKPSARAQGQQQWKALIGKTNRHRRTRAGETAKEEFSPLKCSLGAISMSRRSLITIKSRRGGPRRSPCAHRSALSCGDEKNGPTKFRFRKSLRTRSWRLDIALSKPLKWRIIKSN